MRWGLRQQLLLPLLVILAGMLATAAASTFLSAESAARHQLEMQLQQVARTLLDARFPLTESVLAQMKGFSGADFLLVEDAGPILTTLDSRPSAPVHMASVADDWKDAHFGPTFQLGDESYLVGAIRLHELSRQSNATVYILYPLKHWQSSIWLAVERSLWVIGIASFTAVLVVLFVAKRVVGRIDTIREGTSRIAAGDLSPLALANWRDELGDLARSIDAMTVKLKETEHLRLTSQLGSGLAHHFRNGLAGIRLAIQVHQRSCKNESDRESLEIALQSLAVLDEKLHSFLQLVRTGEIVVRICSLRSVVEQTLQLVQPQCRHGKIEIRWRPPDDPIDVMGDPDQLATLLMNLVTNAMDAAATGGWIEVRLTSRPTLTEKTRNLSHVDAKNPTDSVMMEVLDSGPGPTPDIANRLFQTFATNKAGGIGLGLWIARQIAKSHKGSIEWRDGERPTCFRVRLPAPNNASHPELKS